MTTGTVKKSDLGVRTASAVVMITVAGVMLWLGGVWFDVFVIVIGFVTLAEFSGLILKIAKSNVIRFLALVLGAIYIGSAIYFITQINYIPFLFLIVGSVVCVDTFAYFFGRTLGGPKIAPKISPSKTWTGLLGGIVGATFALSLYFQILAKMRGLESVRLIDAFPILLMFGAIIAVLAQSGDFFESWLKRRAGVKDSSRLLPGHGGVFDRVDGMLPVAILFGFLLVTYYPHWLNR